MNFPIGYGFDLGQRHQKPAQPEPQEPPAEPACPIPKRKRARVRGGQFATDDSATEADEAWAES
ncbi:hypothetical protein EBZ80_23565 [bacterium]|nr:hypothetical protein [bacterium]